MEKQVMKAPSSPKAKKKVGKVMGEFKRGTLKSSSGQKVKGRDQAVAIALSEARSAMQRKYGGKAITMYKDSVDRRFGGMEMDSYGNKKEPFRGSPKKARELGKKDRMERWAEQRMRHAEKYAPGVSLDMKSKGEK
jgi:hypothetical protein